MDSGLARFVVLIVLFFLMTGDLAGMVKHLFEESSTPSGGGYAGKTRAKHQQRTPDTVAAETETAAAGKTDGFSSDGQAPPDHDAESFGKQFSRV